MKLSILICVHSQDLNHDNMLLEALNSLQHQTYKDFDVYIVFDECWNNTISIVKDEDYFFKINKLIHPKKEGLAVAKNFGLENINSEWIGYLDADDMYMPDKLEKQIEYIKNNYVDFLGTMAYNIDRSEKIFDSCIPINKYVTNEQIYNHLINEGNCLTHGSMLIRKKCLDDLGGYKNVKGVEDYDLWKRALLKGYKFYQLQERLYIYRLGTSVAR